MTTLQLKLAIAINEFGSISSAANKLEISQSNACNYLKQLEKEVGFEIFNRTKTGTTLTEKGVSFLEHAKRIIAEQESIMGIKKEINKYRLRVGTINYSGPMEAFLDLCKMHKEDLDADICYNNVSIDEGIKSLNNYNLDVVIAPMLETQITGVMNQCHKNGLEMLPILELPALIFLRKDHPEILNGSITNIERGSSVMKNYPYVAYRNLNNDIASTAYNDSDFVPCSYKIYVDGAEVRLRLVSCTNAFSFGVMPSYNVKERYNLECFKVPGISIHVFYLIRSIDKNKKEIQEFISLFKQTQNNI